jgi:hypothetical protein
MSSRGPFDRPSAAGIVEATVRFEPGKHPILNLPLNSVMRPEIALTLQHVLQIFTVGAFLNAWRNPKNHKSIEQVFDTPQQARHAAAVCATWLGLQTRPTHETPGAWWTCDERPQMDA